MINKRPFFFVLSFFLSVSLVGCAGKSGNNDGDGTGPSIDNPPPTTVKTISFLPSGSPANNSVYLSQVSTNNDEITLNISTKEVINLHGTAIEIFFDSSKIAYLSASKGNFLEQGGANIIFTTGLEQGQNGVLLIAIDRTGTTTGVNGDGLLATIVLKALTDQLNTSVGFNITNSALKLPAGSGNIPGVNWLGGSLSYQ